ncbi:11226_t:CDS:1, partial [Scutellospora calospora]
EYDLAYLESQNKDNLWDIIATSIIKYARSTLSGKKSTVRKLVTGKKRKSRNIKKDLKIIGSMCQQCFSKIGQNIDSTD